MLSRENTIHKYRTELQVAANMQQKTHVRRTTTQMHNREYTIYIQDACIHPAFEDIQVYYSAKRKRLGCVNSPPRPRESGREITQPSLHLLVRSQEMARRSTSISQQLQCRTRQSSQIR